MTNTPVKIPSFYIDFMDSVINNGRDSIIMRSSATSSDASCVELDVRLHDTSPNLTYVIGMIDEKAYFDHPKTGESLGGAKDFIELLGFPKNTPQIDEFYLGPFNEDTILEIMAAADHTAGRLDLEERAENLQHEADRLRKDSEIYGQLSSKRGKIVNLMGEMERATKREERKGLFRVIEGGKSKPQAPKLA